MNVFQKTLILGIVILLVGTSFTSLVGSTRQETVIVFGTKSSPSGVNVTLNGTMGENGWYISCVYIQISFGPDVVSFWYQFNGGNWKLYIEPFGPICEDGEYTFCWFYVDNEGNQSVVECIDFKIDQTPPTTTHTFDGIMGDNNWYKSDVVVTLTSEDDSSGVNYTMYSIDRVEWYQYACPFVVSEDGEHIVWFYSVDLAGNKEDVNAAELKIDKTPPTIDLTWDGENSLIIADVYDETSGVAKVEFYVDGEFVGEVTEAPYEWILNTLIGFSVRGLILNPKITEETVSFFAVIAIGHSIFNYPTTVQAIAYDNAGNCAVNPIPNPPIYIDYYFYIFEQLTFSNDYSGHISKFFIDAVFEDGPV